MALTLGRWLALVAVGTGVITVALLPPRPRPEWRPYRTPIDERRDNARQLEQAQLDLDLARIHAEVERLPRGELAMPGRLLVLPVGSVPATARDSFQHRLDGINLRLPGADSLVIGLVLAGGAEHRELRTRFALPAPADPALCVVALPTNDWMADATHGAVTARDIERVLGPCLYFGAFGRPGPHIGQWVGGPGLAFSLLADFSEPTPAATLSGSNFQRGAPLSWSIYAYNAGELRCFRGDLARCAQEVLTGGGARPSITQHFATGPYLWRVPLGERGPRYLSDLRRTMGDERFTRFWQSGLPVERAFQDAFGISLGQWTHDWLRGSLADFQPGPLPARRSALFAGGLTFFLVGAALAIGGRWNRTGHQL